MFAWYVASYELLVWFINKIMTSYIVANYGYNFMHGYYTDASGHGNLNTV